MTAEEILLEKEQLQQIKAEFEERQKQLWEMSETVYKEKKKIEEQYQHMLVQKESLEKQKFDQEDQVKMLWEQSIAIHHEKERINILKQEIEIKHREVIDSVSCAMRIQEAILPARQFIDSIVPENFILYKPRDIVSGDFYWFAQKSDSFILACVDCTGHGVPGAFMSMIGNTLLNQIVNEREITRPDLILTELDKAITRALKQDKEGTDAHEGMDIAIIQVFNHRTQLNYAGANRPLYLIRDAALLETKPNKLSMGGIIHEGGKNFTHHSINLQKNDLIYMSSDGFADQFGKNDKKMMTKRFKEILVEIRHLSMQEQGSYLSNFVSQWADGAEQTDDILVMGIKI